MSLIVPVRLTASAANDGDAQSHAPTANQSPMNDTEESSSSTHSLPDFRGAATLVQIMVLAGALALIGAVASASSPGDILRRGLAISALAAPALLTALAILYAANDALGRLDYRVGLMVLGLVALVAMGVSLWLARSFDIVLSPFENVVALGLAVLCALGMAEILRLRSQARSPALVAARLQALQARIRPHFLFNSLNAVLSIIRTDPKRAEQAIEDLADLFRTLMADSAKLTTLGREIEVVRDYLRIEQLRLGERLIVEWQIDGTPELAQVPPLFLQPLVENAVYHGVESSRDPGRVEIVIKRSGDRLKLRLTNPYRPEHQGRQGNRMALANIRERLALHFASEASLAAVAVGDRYRIDIELPYRT